MSDVDSRLKKLKFRAWHRGFREADLILGPFADRYVSGFDAAQLDGFEALLEFPDQDLYEWIVERAPTPPEVHGELMSMIKVFRDQVHKSLGPEHGG